MPRTLFAAIAAIALAIPVSADRLTAVATTEVRQENGQVTEHVTFRPGALDSLLAQRIDGNVEVSDFPVAPGSYRDVTFSRREVYAEDARVLLGEAGGSWREIPRSMLQFYAGTVAGEQHPSVALAVDPATRMIDATALHDGSIYRLRPQPKRGIHILSAAASQGEIECGVDSLDSMNLPRRTTPPPAKGTASAAISSLHTMKVVFDTDTELISMKFGGDTTAASNYFALLISSLNLFYERDLLVRLQLGTVFLRAASDPWVQTGSIANKLNEFSTYASTSAEYSGFTGATRGLAAMVSGKGSLFTGSGMAWVGGLCETFAGTSFTQVPWFWQTPEATDIYLIGHEIGHNVGADHTHCDGIDHCATDPGAGCWAGPGTSCPSPSTMNGVANVTGTLMSYCGSEDGPGCSAALVFHPSQISGGGAVGTGLADFIVAATQGQNACVFPYVPPAPVVTSVTPNSGTTLGGTSVTIKGSGFVNGAGVKFDSSSATSVTFVSSSELTATTPAHTTAAVPVTVTNPDASTGTKNNAYFYAPPPTDAEFFTLTPCRILDTRSTTALGPSAQRTVTVAGVCGVPATAKSIAANVTVVTPTAAGFLGFFPGNAFFLGTSQINFRPGQVRANNSILPLATDGTGTVRVINAAGTSHVLLDVSGYFE